MASTRTGSYTYTRSFAQCVCGREFTARGIGRHISSAHPELVTDVEAAHAEAWIEDGQLDWDHEVALQMNEDRETFRRDGSAHAEALAINAERDEEDYQLEALTASEALEFETTGQLPGYLSPAQAAQVRRAFNHRGLCPWSHVTSVLADGTIEGPCTRWGGHPGGCAVKPLPVRPESLQGSLVVRRTEDTEGTRWVSHQGAVEFRDTLGRIWKRIPGLALVTRDGSPGVWETLRLADAERMYGLAPVS